MLLCWLGRDVCRDEGLKWGVLQFACKKSGVFFFTQKAADVDGFYLLFLQNKGFRRLF